MRDNRRVRPENWGRVKRKIAEIIKDLLGEYPTRIGQSYAGRHQKASGCCIWWADMPNLMQILGVDSMVTLLKEYETFEITQSGVVAGDWWFDGKDKKEN